MRRLALSMAVALSVSLLVATSVVAAPAKGCPAGASGFTVFQIDPVPGDGIAAPGENAWWDQTLAGIAEEGQTPEQAAADFGFASVEELFEGIMEALRGLDRNGDNQFCAKPFPDTEGGQLAYFFNAIDNQARAR